MQWKISKQAVISYGISSDVGCGRNWYLLAAPVAGGVR